MNPLEEAELMADKKQRKGKSKKQRRIKEKYLEENLKKVKPLVAKSKNQKKALKAFTEKQMVVLSGSSGVGKSELACWWASKLWLEGTIDTIVITRPYQHLGNDYGAIKGDDTEKLLPFCMSMLMKFKKYLGTGILKNNFNMTPTDFLFQEVSGISIVPIEKIQGMSFDNKTIIVADEIQNATVGQVKSLVTRLEDGCQLIITGDRVQSAIGHKNGLSMVTDLIDRHPHEDVSMINFTPADNCRSGVSGFMANIFEQEGIW